MKRNIIHPLLALFLSMSVALSSFAQSSYSNPEFEMFLFSIKSSSSFKINGSSNINSFECSYDFSSMDTIRAFNSKTTNSMLLRNTAIQIRTADINCFNPLINNDLKEALKSDQFEYITLTIHRIIDHARNFDTSEFEEYTAEATIQIMDQQKEVKLIFIKNITGKNQIAFKGSLKLTLSEFGIPLPEKLGGLITVDDLLIIEYDIQLWSEKPGS